MPRTKTSPATATAEPAVTKKEAVLNLLRADQGTTIDAIVAATSWQPHSARAVLTGLRKKGYLIERCSRDGTSFYKTASEPHQ